MRMYEEGTWMEENLDGFYTGTRVPHEPGSPYGK